MIQKPARNFSDSENASSTSGAPPERATTRFARSGNARPSAKNEFAGRSQARIDIAHKRDVSLEIVVAPIQATGIDGHRVHQEHVFHARKILG
jgi:hypothetical protein